VTKSQRPQKLVSFQQMTSISYWPMEDHLLLG